MCRSERHRVLQMVPTRGSNGLGGVPAPCQGHNPAGMVLLPTCSPMAPPNPCMAPLGIAGRTLTPAERAAPSFSASTMSLSPCPNLCLKVRMWGVRNPAKTTLRGPCARPSVSAPRSRRCLAEVAASSTTHPRGYTLLPVHCSHLPTIPFPCPSEPQRAAWLLASQMLTWPCEGEQILYPRSHQQPSWSCPSTSPVPYQNQIVASIMTFFFY